MIKDRKIYTIIARKGFNKLDYRELVFNNYPTNYSRSDMYQEGITKSTCMII